MTERVPLAELVGTELGDYSVERIVGHGSMGVVFEARHRKLGRRVALKALPPGLGSAEKAVQRFLREAQAVARLQHENIVPIFDIAQHGAIHYYAMQFLEGEPLDRVVKRGALPPREAARLACTAARAVHFAHQHGIIHRDIKPGNLILESGGRVVLTDFGLARPEQGSGITDSGAMVGTPLYMSPEQVRARKGEIDRRTDVYSLGATLYELISGRPPFTGESTQEILQQILEEEPRPLSTYAPQVPADLEVIVHKALEKEPRRRYASSLELAQDLERYLEGEPILAHRSSILGRTWRRVRKHRTIAILSCVVGLVTLGFSFTMKWQRDGDQRRRFSSACEGARAAIADESWLAALDRWKEALQVRPAELDALLGKAKALCFIGQSWESANLGSARETRPQLAERFGTVDKLYAEALSDLIAVTTARPDDPAALFYRGFLRWRSSEKFLRNQGAEDLLLAESKGESDWETQAELANFRLALARDKRRGADERGEILQGALNSASNSVKLFDDLAAAHAPISPRRAARVRLTRAEIYFELFELGGNARTYLELARDDCGRSLEEFENPRAQTLRATVDQRLADSAAPGRTVAEANADSDSGLAADVITLLGASQKSQQSEALAKLLARGGELLAAGWQRTDGLREELLGRFVSPYLPAELRVSDADRRAAETEAEAARKILREAIARGDLSPADRVVARDHLVKAVDQNRRSAQYLFELGVVEHGLDEFEKAHEHLLQAAAIAPSNPLFLQELARVCERMERYDDALGYARRASSLAPTNPEFLRVRARCALAAAAHAQGEPRQQELDEARAAVATLEKLAPEDATLAGLRDELAVLAAQQ